jgi:predicted nucleic acid-binding protein
MLDTDILSEFLRGNQKVLENVERYLDEYDSVNISVITYYEIQNGLLYKDAKKQLAKFEEFVNLNNVIPLTIPMAKKAAEIQAYLRNKGTIIGHTDTLIAGIAMTNNLQLITNNTEHFKRVKGIDLDNWTK